MPIGKLTGKISYTLGTHPKLYPETILAEMEQASK